MKRIAITSLYANVTYNDKNHRGLETIYSKKLLEENGYSVDIVGYKNRNVKDLNFFIDYTKTNFSEYDIVIIQPSQPNFFGGVISKHTEKVVNDLAKYEGKICYFVNDPLIKPTNPSFVLKRFEICQAIAERWGDIIRNATYIFPGKDVSRFIGFTPIHQVRFDWFTYIFQYKLDKKLSGVHSSTEKKYDLVYYGDNRRAFREKQLIKYFPKTTNNLLIGYKTKKIKADFIKKLPHDQLLEKLDECKVSFVTADKEHFDNVKTFRIYETLASNCLAAIQIEIDPNKEIIKNDKLRKLLYVESSEDIKKLIDCYSQELVDLQKEELKRLLNSYEYMKIDL